MKYFFLYLTFGILFFAFPSAPSLFAQTAGTNSTELLKRIKKEIDVRKDYKQAIELCKKGIKDYPNDVDFLFLYGKACLMNQDPARAQKAVAEILQKAPQYKDAYLLGANIQLVRRNNPAASELVSKGLSRFPGDRDLGLKKLDILKSGGSYWSADNHAVRLLQMFPKDPVVFEACVNYYNSAGNAYLRQGNYTKAAMEFDKVLEMSPANPEALRGNLTVKTRSGDNCNSLSAINRALSEHPGAHEFLMKKVTLLQGMKRYPEALETLKELQKRYPADAKARSLETELRLEAARYYKSTDPYYQYQGVLEKAPGNREALNNAIEMSISHEQPDEAMALINKALKKNPSDRALLTR
ncbi:MAG: tetratricopeptide repeat protein, partial [Bacteroidota bacterium]|nr:tetratricopeptide repeat protein [Bacteroidota bacterium]